MSHCRVACCILLSLAFLAGARPAAAAPEDEFSQTFLKTYCLGCHSGKSPVAGINLAQPDPRTLNRALARVRGGDMPPVGRPAPSLVDREKFVAWADTFLRSTACAAGVAPGPSPIRRLNRSQYAATMADLLNIRVNAGHALPADGAGGEGFDNAAETLFLSPIHAEKYLAAAKEALDYGVKDPRSRTKFLIAEPNATTTPEQAAHKILAAFLPRAFRRPSTDAELEKYMVLFRGAQKRGENFTQSILFALQGVLISPHFLFRVEQPNPDPEPRLVDDYALATRLSYFLWGTMPDDALFDLAAKGKLHEPDTLKQQVARMLKDAKTAEFAEQFVEQWLNTRELGRDIKPNPELFPTYYDAELQSAIRYEPILFFKEIVSANLSLLNLLDSKFTILSNKLEKHYGLTVGKTTQQPKRFDLPPDSHRGGVLSMAAVLAVSSYPQRTSPVLRGKWILEAILGAPPPPPPPNVPELKDNHEGAAPKTLRERLEQHRQDPVCAGCHNRIDPLGFALENYDVLGRWRTEDSGKPIDAKGNCRTERSSTAPSNSKPPCWRRKTCSSAT